MGTVTSEPAGIDCGESCQAEFALGTEVMLSAQLAGAASLEWEGCDEQSDTTCSVVMNSDRSVVARFVVDEGETPKDAYRLRVLRDGRGKGAVTSSPDGIDCVEPGEGCDAKFAEGTEVTLEASVAPGSSFAGWSGEHCSGTGSCELTMTSDKQVTATFNERQYTLDVNVSAGGAGRVFNVNDLGKGNPSIDCTDGCSYDYPGGITIGLRAQALNAAEHEFDAWAGDCSGTGTCNLTLDQDKQVTANFRYVPPVITSFTPDPGNLTRGAGEASTLTWEVSGGGDIILTLTSDNDPDVQDLHVTGETSHDVSPLRTSTYQLTAANDSGQHQESTTVVVGRRPNIVTFAATPETEAVRPDQETELVWDVSGDGDIEIVVTNDDTGDEVIRTSETSGSVTDTPGVTTSYTLSATSTFGSDSAETRVTMLYRLTLLKDKEALGSGTVTSDPEGIDCRSGCDEASADFLDGEEVTLTASTSLRMRLDSWTGCDREPDNQTCIVTMNEDRDVTATFGFWIFSE